MIRSVSIRDHGFKVTTSLASDTGYITLNPQTEGPGVGGGGEMSLLSHVHWSVSLQVNVLFPT